MCTTVVEDPHLWEQHMYYDHRGADEFHCVDAAFGLVVEVPAEDCKGHCLQAGMVAQATGNELPDSKDT